jgi:hypothetical protein
LRELTLANPHRILRDLPEIHPTVAHALRTAVTNMCPAEGVYPVAVPTAAFNTAPEEGSPDEQEVDDRGTAELNALFASTPPEAGGSLRGLRAMLAADMLLTGMPVIECVPGAKLKGLYRVWPVDSLTCELRRATRDSDLQLMQLIRHPEVRPAATRGTGPAYTNWVPLPPETCFWGATNQRTDMPYGVAHFYQALPEAIADMALIESLRDAVHNAAWPRMQFGVDKKKLHETAVETYRITDPGKAAEWVNDRFGEFVDYINNLGADDNVAFDSAGDLKTMQPGSFQGLSEVLSFLRQRLAQSLKTLPTLLGINDGSTFNYTSVEWGVYASGLEADVAVVDDILCKAGTLHLRLCGIDAVCVMKGTSIRKNDEGTDATTMSTKVTNAQNLERAGYMGHDQASMYAHGKKAYGPAQPGVIEPLPDGTAPGAAGQTNSNKRVGSEQGTRQVKKPVKKPPQQPGTGGKTPEER